MNSCRILTIPVGSGRIFTARKEGRMAASCALEDGMLDLSLWYDVRPEPLHLRAAAEPGDEARVTIRPFRIELYVNGVLEDEEWPYGNCLMDSADTIDGLAPGVTLCEEREEPEPPSVIGTFTDAGGWVPQKNTFIGDCMPYTDGGRYHVLYLKDRHHHQSKWGLGAHQWEHISTDDLVHWQIHPTAVAIDDPLEASICTGSHIRVGGRHYLYYSIRTVDHSPAYIRRSISEDGYHYRKDRAFGFALPEYYDQASCRDPKVIQTRDGRYHMFVTTSTEVNGAMHGCLAHTVSDDGEIWTTLEKPIYISPDDAQPECSDYFTLNGKYYLIFSLNARGRYLISDHELDGFSEPEDSFIPSESVPKCAVWNDRIIFTGFNGHGHYAGNFVFTEAFQNADGTLRFAAVQA